MPNKPSAEVLAVGHKRNVDRSMLPELPSGARVHPNSPHSSVEKAEARRMRFLMALEECQGMLHPALERAEVKHSTYRAWRDIHKGFGSKTDAIRAKFYKGAAGIANTTHEHEIRDLPRDFATFRKRYWGFDSPWFHLEIIKALETAEEGSVTLILMPPEHGKTTLLEDFCCYKLSQDPDFRITIGSEKQNHGKKIISRVKSRMTPGQGDARFILEQGPFTPSEGPGRSQTWAEDRFNVIKRSGDERDYSMIAQGITSSVVGTRSDLMVIDDIQSRKSLSQTMEIVGDLRQDWLSRTGAFGRVVVIGTRIGPGDVYEELENSTLVNKVIRYPAYEHSVEQWDTPTGHNPKEDPDEVPSHITTFLWPERYSPKNYLVMRVNAGEEGWNRNYLQRGEASGAQPFTPDMLAAASRPEFSVMFRHRHAGLGGQLVAAIDPGFGVNCTMIALMTRAFCMPVLWRSDIDLTNTQQIWQVLRDAMDDTIQGDQRVIEVVIEDKAFQKGLLDDEGLRALRDRYGFRVHGHQTGINKYDPDLGIPQMARSFERGEILLPGAPDEWTQLGRKELDHQMVRWRPYKRGNRLTQDLVITLWFCWMTWRRNRDTLDTWGGNTQGWQGQGLASPTPSSGLLLPTGAYGFRG